MRTSFFVLTVFVLTISSCKKQDTNPSSNLGVDTGCIERVFIPENLHSITSAEKTIVDNLFMTNGLVNQHYRFTRFLHDSFQTYYPPYAIKDNKNVRADHYVNGLLILEGDLIFNFINDTLSFVGGDTTSRILLDKIHQLNLGQVRKLFIDDAERFEQLGNHFRDTCLRAEFGYFRQYINSNNDVKIYKGWLIKPHYYDYPYSVHLDSAGVLIVYDNGIRYFH